MKGRDRTQEYLTILRKYEEEVTPKAFTSQDQAVIKLIIAAVRATVASHSDNRAEILKGLKTLENYCLLKGYLSEPGELSRG